MEDGRQVLAEAEVEEAPVIRHPVLIAAPQVEVQVDTHSSPGRSTGRQVLLTFRSWCRTLPLLQVACLSEFSFLRCNTILCHTLHSSSSSSRKSWPNSRPIVKKLYLLGILPFSSRFCHPSHPLFFQGTRFPEVLPTIESSSTTHRTVHRTSASRIL